MTHIKVMKQALEVLKAAYVPADLDEQREKAITAIKQAIAQDALEKMAENARELGLDYETPPVQEPVAYDKTEMNCFVQELYDKKMCEGKHGHYETMFHCVHQAIKRVPPPAAQPAVQEPVAWMFQHDETGRMNYVGNDGIHNPTMFLEMNPRYALVCPLYTTPPAPQPVPVQEPWKPSDTANRIGGLPQDFIEHKVKNEGDWSEWVNPDSEQYFMKCCDCGLVHEMQFKVVKYSEGDECEFIDDADLQSVFRARRATPPAAQKPWVGLTDEEVENFVATLWPLAEEPVRDRLRAIEAKLKEKNHA
jgi:hypothetical protein